MHFQNLINSSVDFIYKSFFPLYGKPIINLFSLSTIIFFYFLSVKADVSIFVGAMSFFAFLIFLNCRSSFQWNQPLKLSLLFCILYLLSALLSSLININMLSNFFMMLLWPLCLLCGYLLALIAPDRRYVPARMNVLAILFTALFIAPCYDLLIGEASFIINQNGLGFLTPHPSRLGVFAAAGLFLCCYEWPTAKGIAKLICALSSLALIIIIYLTGVRTIIFAMIIVGCLVLLLYFIRKRRQWYKMLLMVPIIICIIVVYNYVSDVHVSTNQKLLSFIQHKHKEPTIVSRIAIWDASYNLFKEAPVFGHGVRSFRGLYRDYAKEHTEEFNKKYFYWEADVSTSHNMFLGRMVETGLVGTFFYFLFYLYLLYRCIKLPGRERWVGLYLLFYLLVGMFNDMPHRINDCFIFFLAGAALAGTASKNKMLGENAVLCPAKS